MPGGKTLRAQSPRYAGLGVLLLSAALLFVNSLSAAKNCSSLRPVHSGQIAPDFSIPRIDSSGQLQSDLKLSTLRGSVVILDFWATWCGPCQSSMPVLEELAQQYRDRGLVVLSVNIEGARKARDARAMVQSLSPSVELLSDSGVASPLYKVTTIPHMLVLDRAGVVRWVHRGFASASGLRSDLVDAIEGLL